ncbi:hypothetical protein [Tenacibaculum halocynthiae]|uniref:hypothetical protein n=1 Tax=Tenacibaculum halocynthiae TaxID=1254437 RepID=UPI003D6483DC
MKKIGLLIALISCTLSFGQNKSQKKTKTIHVFVALCDNINQGIVPVPKLIGNGQDPKNNLYWGALYGVKNFLKNKSNDWVYKKMITSKNTNILESILFKHKTKNIYLLAEAYDGEKIKVCTEDFLLASNNNLKKRINYNEINLEFGGNSELVAYIGHDGLMEFKVNLKYKQTPSKKIDAIILACASKNYFQNEIIKSKANPILWTTNLMAPEAYTLEAALNSWVKKQKGIQIKEAASKAYNKYQKCGLKGARRLFVTGF